VSKIKALLSKWCLSGLKLPFAHDPLTGKPSVTLLFLYITFVIASGSVIALHFKVSDIPATFTSIMFWSLAMIFYRLRKIDEAGINLKTGQVDVRDTEDKASEPEHPESGNPSL
jgi:hypothetical protein